MFMMIIYVAIFIFGILLLSKITPSYRRSEIRWLMAFIAAICIVSFCCLNVYLFNSFEAKILFSRLRYIGYALIAQTWFFFLLINFSKIKFIKSPFFVIPMIVQMGVTVIFTIIPQTSHLIVFDFSPFHWQGADLLTFKNGSWFNFHIITAYLCGLISLFYALIVAVKSEGNKRRQLLILSIGGSFGLIADSYCVITNSPLRWVMISGVGFLLAEISIYYAVIKHGLLNLSSVARDQIFQSISDALIIIDEQQNVVDANLEAKKRFSITDKLPLPLSHFGHLKNLNLSINSQEIETGDSIFLVGSQPLKNSNGTILIFHEVTMQRKQLHSLSRDLDFKGELLKMITHDFSGILNLQSYLSSALEDEVSPELKEKAGALKNSSLSTRDMMTNVLLWAKSQQKEFTPVISIFELNTLIKETITHQETMWSAKKIKITQTTDLDQTYCILTGDSVMIESVLRNILSNAIRASHNSGKIEIHTSQLGEAIKISVIDEGEGIPEHKLMNLKTNAKEPLRDSQGFGIGLLIAKHFINIHRGEFFIESTLGKGSIVSFTLPLKS